MQVEPVDHFLLDPARLGVNQMPEGFNKAGGESLRCTPFFSSLKDLLRAGGHMHGCARNLFEHAYLTNECLPMGQQGQELTINVIDGLSKLLQRFRHGWLRVKGCGGVASFIIPVSRGLAKCFRVSC